LLSPNFAEALTFEARLHNAQTSHLLCVAGLVLEFGGTEDEAIAALLHDAGEDQGGQATLDRIRRRFGPVVADVVEACSDADVQPKPEWRARKEAYIANVGRVSDSARLVSAADKLHDGTAVLRDYRHLGEKLWERFRGGKDGTLWYYRSLVDAYQAAGTHPIWAELDRVVSELEAEVFRDTPQAGEV
jgi:GTP pyrophosphokinase